MRLIADFSSEVIEARRQGEDVCKVLKAGKCQPGVNLANGAEQDGSASKRTCC